MIPSRNPIFRAIIQAAAGLCCCLAFFGAAPAEAEDALMPLRVFVETNRQPFSFRTPTGVLAGFDVSIAHALCREMRRPCLVSSRSLPLALEELQEGSVDMIVAGLVPTPQLRERFDFSERYYRAGSVFIGKKGMHSLAGARFGALTGSSQMDYLRARSDMLSLRGSMSQDALWTMLESGSIDAVLVDNLLAFAFLLSPAGAAYDTIGPSLSPDIVPGTHHIAVKKGDSQLQQAINKALETLRRNGQYLALSYKYFALDID